MYADLSMAGGPRSTRCPGETPMTVPKRSPTSCGAPAGLLAASCRMAASRWCIEDEYESSSSVRTAVSSRTLRWPEPSAMAEGEAKTSSWEGPMRDASASGSSTFSDKVCSRVCRSHAARPVSPPR